jgi:hypothetical protein
MQFNVSVKVVQGFVVGPVLLLRLTSGHCKNVGFTREGVLPIVLDAS